MSDGIRLLDLAELPSPWRTVLRLVMREISMSHEALWQAVCALPDQERLDPATLAEVLDALCSRDWLMVSGDGAERVYRVSLSRRGGTKNLSNSIWNALGEAEASAPARPRRGMSGGLLGRLDDDAPAPERRAAHTLSSDLWSDPPKADEKAEKKPDDIAPEPRRTPRKSLWDSLGGDDEKKG
jgi:hypothetical protein